MTRPPLENMLCVDLCYLIFRTCLALKAMMVCMAKDLLAYTAAMVVGVINRKVIYVSHFIRMLLLNNRLVTRSRVDGTINGHKKRISFCIKCVLVYNRHNKLHMAYNDGMIVYVIMQPHEPILSCIVNTRNNFTTLFDITSNMK